MKRNLIFVSFLLAGILGSCGSDPAPPKPTSLFNFEKKSAGAVTFTNLSTNATSYAWIFGDGTSSDQMNPSHTYLTNGSFSVEMTATGPGGKAVSSQSISITNINPMVGNWNLTSFSIINCSNSTSNIPTTPCGGSGAPNTIPCQTVTITTNTILLGGISIPYTYSGNEVTTVGVINFAPTFTFSTDVNSLTWTQVMGSGAPGCLYVINFTKI